MNRSLSWHQDTITSLAPYSLAAGPEAAVWLEAYPAAFSTAGFASRIGIFGGFNQGFGVNSSADNGATKLTTSFQDFHAGAKLRWPVSIFAPYASVAYGAQSFKLTTQSGTPPMIPSVAYKFIRLGIGSRADFSPQVSADLGLAFMLLTDAGKNAGEIKSAAYFPGTTGNAIDVGASVAYRFTKIIGARAGIDFRQYGLSANPAQRRGAGGRRRDRSLHLLRRRHRAGARRRQRRGRRGREGGARRGVARRRQDRAGRGRGRGQGELSRLPSRCGARARRATAKR